MQLYNPENHKGSCMLTYDSFSGYVDKSFSSNVFREGLEGVPPSLSLNSRDARNPFLNQLLRFFNANRLITHNAKCRPLEAAHFQECYPKSLTQHCHKIGEGLYGEVFLFRNPHAGTTVMKIIPIEGDQPINGEYQKKFKEVLSEILIATELSNLRSNPFNQTSSFIEVQNVQLVHGIYPEDLLQLWDLYKETRGSINDSPVIFKSDQLYAILETSYGGCDMESFLFDNASEAFSMVLQVALAIAVAEEELQFEHRDLHWGNILLTRMPSQEPIAFKLEGRDVKIESHGIKASIIDFTMSRITVGGLDVFTDLGKDCGIFNGSGDYQFEIYKMMQKRNGNDWGHYEPYSNILWLSYLLDKTITALNYKNPSSKLHRKYLSKLKKLNLEILGYDTTREFVQNLFNN